MTKSGNGVRFMWAIVALIGFVIFNASAFAQTANGIISGVVQDESGAVVPGVNVTVTNVETGISRSMTTDSAGRYRVPGLIPDHYEVQAQITGFQTEVRKGIELTVGSEKVINLALKVGQVAEKTVVTAEAPLVETTTSSLSSLVGAETIRDLPLNGRSFDQLISLQASMPTNYNRGTAKAAGAAMAFSVNGARGQSNLFIIDGTEMVGGGNQTSMPGGVLGKLMGVDAVQEFTVLSSNYSAAYGKKGGGIINIATKSGGNGLHGSMFEFLRNAKLDARMFFDPNPQPPPFKRNQFGGSLGGPIRKDHTFFFGNYEALRERLGVTSIAIVPDNNARLGLLPDPERPGQFINVGVAPAVKPFFVLYPAVNGRIFKDLRGVPTGTGEYISSPSSSSGQDFFLVRVDHKISERDSLFGRYYFSQASQINPQAIPTFNEDNASRDQIVTLEEKRVYPTTLNVIRFGYTRGHLFGTSKPTISLSPELAFLPGAPAPGQINFTTNSVGGSISRAGPGSAIDRAMTVNQFDTGDQVFLYRGAHSFQFGGNFQRIQHNDGDSSDTWGNYLFADLPRFLQGIATRFQAPSPAGGDLHKAWRFTYFALFVQDDYKVSRNVTLNLGVRYEALTPPTEASGNRIANFRSHFVNGLRVLDSKTTVGSPYYKSNKDLFAPRVGLAWDVFGDGKMAVRAGFGIFYDLIDSDVRFYTPNNPPFFSSFQVSNPPFPLGFSAGLGRTPTVRADGIDFDLNAPTRVQYNFSVQRQVTASTLVTAGYVGSHSYHLTRVNDSNNAIAQIQADGTKFYPPPPSTGVVRRNPDLGTSRVVFADADSFYNSLQLELTQRVSHGLRYKVSYTFAKNLDEQSATTSQHGTGVPTVSQDPDNIRAERGLSTFDVRNNVVMNFTYDTPWNSVPGALGKLVSGWQVGTIATLSAGQPFTASTGFNRSRDAQDKIADRPNLVAGKSNNPVLGGPDRYFDSSVFALPPAGTYGNLARNTLIGPGLAVVDFSLVKITPITERIKLDFRAEFFNVLNRANFDLPNTQIFQTNGQFQGSAGRIQNTKTTSRQIQFALKLNF